MKKIILVLGLLFMTLVTNAQDVLDEITSFGQNKIDMISAGGTFEVAFEPSEACLFWGRLDFMGYFIIAKFKCAAFQIQMYKKSIFFAI